MTQKICKSCQQHRHCPLQSIIDEVESMFSWSDVIITLEDHGDQGHKVVTNPPEAYDSVMTVLGSLMRQANEYNIYLAARRPGEMGHA